MRKEYYIEIQDIPTNRKYIYKTFATSFEDSYIKAKVLHNHHMHTTERNSELITITKKQNNENKRKVQKTDS